jgi:predicted PurR-regulated permease PerM
VSPLRRSTVLAGLFVALSILAVVILREVLGTIFLAITVAYVLWPIRERLVERGLGTRLAAAAGTAVGFVVVLAIALPIVYVGYVRYPDVLFFLTNLPDTFVVRGFGTELVVEVGAVLSYVRTYVQSIAVSSASALTVLAFKLALFVLVVYALLLRPGAIRTALLESIPADYHDIVLALHRRLRSVLYGIYVLQAATAAGTVATAFVVFALLGYESPFVLAILSGLLQFLPIVGPTLVILGLAALEVIAGDLVAALVVTVLGLTFVSFLPDAVVRPRLASVTAGMPGSLYFVGFAGGILTLGVVGIIAGPVVVGLLVEIVELLAGERRPGRQTRLG